MATNVPFCRFIQFLEQLLKFLANFALLEYVKSQRSYGFLITKKLILDFKILDLKVHFSASLIQAPFEFSNQLRGQCGQDQGQYIPAFTDEPN